MEIHIHQLVNTLVRRFRSSVKAGCSCSCRELLYSFLVKRLVFRKWGISPFFPINFSAQCPDWTIIVQLMLAVLKHFFGACYNVKSLVGLQRQFCHLLFWESRLYKMLEVSYDHKDLHFILPCFLMAPLSMAGWAMQCLWQVIPVIHCVAEYEC